MEIANKQLVGVQGEEIVIMLPKTKMSKDEALVHAAWLVALADMTGDKFQDVLDAVNNS